MPQRIPHSTQPPLGLDLDGCIDECPMFFSTLSHLWPGLVIVVTFRDDRTKAEADLARHGVRWDELVLADRVDGKAKVVAEKGIAVFFDDQPEMLQHMPQSVQVMLVRNGGNYDFEEQRWLYSKRTGRQI